MTRERHAVLERIRDQVPPTAEAFERLAVHRDTKARDARRRATALGTAITLAIVVAVVTVWRVSPDGSLGSQPGSDQQGPRLVAAEGEYYYVLISTFSGASTTGGNGSTTTQIGTERVVKLWIGPDRSGRIVEMEEGSETFEPGELPADILVDLPTAADQVIPALVARSAPDGPSPIALATTSPGRTEEMTAVLRAMQDLLGYGSGFLSPQQQDAMLEAAGTIADVTTETDVIDPLGRPATKLTFVIDYGEGGASNVEWYVEPTTGQFMAQLWVDRATGEVQSATLVRAAGITDSVDEPARGSALYVPAADSAPAFLED